MIAMADVEPSQSAELRPTRRRWRLRLTFLALATSVLLAGWWGLFSLNGYENDPRSPRYLLWKYCGLPIPRDTALAAAARDPGRDRLIAALTAAEVERKFDRALLRADGPYLTNSQQRYAGSGDYAWFAESLTIVQFEHGRAVRMWVRKG